MARLAALSTRAFVNARHTPGRSGTTRSCSPPGGLRNLIATNLSYNRLEDAEIPVNVVPPMCLPAPKWCSIMATRPSERDVIIGGGSTVVRDFLSAHWDRVGRCLTDTNAAHVVDRRRCD